MSEFNPRFKEGSLVNVSFEAIVTDVMLGSDEKDTWYNVFIPIVGEVRQYKSSSINERNHDE